MTPRVWVVEPFRRPTFRKAISTGYPMYEPWDSAPLVIAGGLLDAGLEVRYFALQNVFDGWLPDLHLEVLRRILADPPDVLLFAADDFIGSRSTATTFGMRVVASIVRETSPATSLVATGRLATASPEGLLDEVPDLDHVLTGEWAEEIGSFVQALTRGDQPARICQAPTQPPGRSLDTLPMPAWHLLNESIDWFERLHPAAAETINISLRTSVGCKFRCKFCAGVPYWNNYRTKSPRRVDEELQALDESLGARARVSFLEDELFTRDPQHAIAVAKVLKTHGVHLDGVYTHSSLLTSDVLSALSEVTSAVYLGLDNSSDDLLKRMGKGQSMETVLQALQRASHAGVPVHLEWIVGAPQETLDIAVENLHAMFVLASSGLVAGVNTYVYCPHPGTQYARDCQRYDLNILGSWDEMLESGGFPAADTRELSRQQIFVLYLFSQLMLREVDLARQGGFKLEGSSYPNYAELNKLLQEFSKNA